MKRERGKGDAMRGEERTGRKKGQKRRNTKRRKGTVKERRYELRGDR